MAELLGHGLQHRDGISYDLGADAAALDDGDILVHARASFAFKKAIRPPLAIMSLMKGGKGSAWYVSFLVMLVMTPVSKSTDTSSPSSMPSLAAGHSRIARPMLMALRYMMRAKFLSMT